MPAGSAGRAFTLDEYFDGCPESRLLFDAVLAVVEAAGPAEYTISKSQIAFRARKAFAWVWVPGKYLRGRVAPLVLTVCFPGRDPSRRWKEIVQPTPGRFMHHLELYATSDVDDEVACWVREARALAV